MKFKIISCLLAAILLFTFTTPIAANAKKKNKKDKEIYVENVCGIKRQFEKEVDIVESDKEFNFTLKNITFDLQRDKIDIKTEIEGKKISFDVSLFKSQLGYNAPNSVYGITNKIKNNFRLVKFTIEKDAKSESLMKPNLEMIGNTVVTLCFYNTKSNDIYYFQFICNSLENLPNVKSNPENFKYELANFSATPYEDVKNEFDSLSYNESVEVGSIDFTQADKTNECTVVSDQSDEARQIDELVDVCKDNGPINLNKRRNLVTNIPDSVYKKKTSGWEHNVYSYKKEGKNVSTCVGYTIYHMPDYTTGNLLNYVMRFENVINYNFNSQQFYNTWKITHNIWVMYNQHNNNSYIFDARSSNARIVVTAKPYLETTTKKGYFTHFSQSAISNGSTVKKISKIVISFVPKLSSTAQKIESITAGTKLVTGSEHATNRKAKKLTHQVGNLIKPNDQVTVKGVGTDIDNISYGFNYSCKTK